MGTSGSEDLRIQSSPPPIKHKDEGPHQADIYVDFTSTAEKETSPERAITSESFFGKEKTGPGRFSFFSAKLSSNVSSIRDIISPDGSLSGLFARGPIGSAWWLDIVNPTEEEINALVDAFSIHPWTERDIKTGEARERFELFRHYYHVCFHSFYRTDKAGALRSFNVHVIVFPEGTLSFTFHSGSQHTANVRTRMARLRDHVTFTSDWICYALFDDIIDSFGPVTDEIDKETDTIEDDVSIRGAGDHDSLLMQIHVCRQKVFSTLRLLSGKANIIKILTKSCGRGDPATPKGDIKLYLDDIQDHVVAMISNLNHFDEILLRSRSSYLAYISVEKIRAKHRIFQTISKCATIAAILVLLNIVSGLFGMNVPVPGQMTEGVRWWLGIAGVVAALTGLSAILARRKKLL